ncbi:MAG: LapA family protein [Acidimicrobiia bacterium]
MAWKGPEPPPPVDDAASERPATPIRTRLSSVWTFAAAGAAILLLLLVFILQNTQRADLEFLWFDFRLPVGAALLLAGVIGALLVVLVGASRLLQLRVAARRRRPHDR